jgi:prepilin-type N-terminal cleavage/methylation domain-containing protein
VSRRSPVKQLASESGFTLVELLMAIVVAAIGLSALVTTLAGSRDLVTVAEKKETMIHQAERELERILALPYPAVALNSAPGASSGDPDDPRRFVTEGTPPSYRWDQDATPQTHPLVIDTTAGTLAPLTPWTDGQSRLSGDIHCFVTTTDDQCESPSCPGVQAARRVTVVVTVDAPGGGPERSVLIDSIKIDPTTTG